jgi:hypothetical protein
VDFGDAFDQPQMAGEPTLDGRGTVFEIQGGPVDGFPVGDRRG